MLPVLTYLRYKRVKHIKHTHCSDMAERWTPSLLMYSVFRSQVTLASGVDAWLLEPARLLPFVAYTPVDDEGSKRSATSLGSSFGRFWGSGLRPMIIYEHASGLESRWGATHSDHLRCLPINIPTSLDPEACRIPRLRSWERVFHWPIHLKIQGARSEVVLF